MSPRPSVRLCYSEIRRTTPSHPVPLPNKPDYLFSDTSQPGPQRISKSIPDIHHVSHSQKHQNTARPAIHFQPPPNPMNRPQNTSVLPGKRAPVWEVSFEPKSRGFCGPRCGISPVLADIPVRAIAGEDGILESLLDDIRVLLLSRLFYLDDECSAVEDRDEQGFHCEDDLSFAGEEGGVVCGKTVRAESGDDS